MIRAKKIGILSSLFLIGLVFIFLSLSFDLQFTWELLFETIWHFDTNTQEQVLMMSRISRVLVALFVGASLGLSGFVMQLQYQNELAEPSLMGISDGSALFISLMMVLNPNATMVERILISLVGSSVVYLLIYIMTKNADVTNSRLNLPLLGIVLSMLLSSSTTFIVTYFNVAQSVSAWYSSRLYRVSLTEVIYFLPFLFLGILLLILFRKELDVYAFGYELTMVIGMKRQFLNITLSLVAVILTGISVAIVGRMAFIGLIIPHISKLIVGKKCSNNILLIPLLGGILVLMSDYLSRIINYPFETPVNVVISLIGVPLFLYLIKKGGQLKYD